MVSAGRLPSVEVKFYHFWKESSAICPADGNAYEPASTGTTTPGQLPSPADHGLLGSQLDLRAQCGIAFVSDILRQPLFGHVHPHHFLDAAGK